MSILTAYLIKNCLYHSNKSAGREGGLSGRCRKMRVKPSSIITECQYILPTTNKLINDTASGLFRNGKVSIRKQELEELKVVA